MYGYRTMRDPDKPPPPASAALPPAVPVNGAGGATPGPRRRLGRILNRRVLSRVALAAAAAVLIAAASLAWPLPRAADPAADARSIRLTGRDGTLLREIRPDGRGTPVALADVPPFAVAALVATEDRRFYRHAGVDAAALGRAVWTALRRGRARSGASTLTMQVARGLRAAETGGGPRGLWDKLAEMHLALRLERHLDKRAILALWLNRAYFGGGAYGIEAAAQTAFGTRARDLTRADAALLVGLPQRPTAYDLRRHPEAALARRRVVLAAAVREHLLTAAEAADLAAAPLALTTAHAPVDAMHLAERLRPSMPDGATEVRTTLDARTQATAEALVRTHLARLAASGAAPGGGVGVNAAVVVLDNATGDVLAYVGSGDYWDAPALGRNDGAVALRQAGSALKPFVYGLALDTRRTTAASILADIETDIPDGRGAYRPRNYDRTFHGPVPLRQALASSFNVPAVALARDLGPATLLGALRQDGFATLTRDAETYGVGLALGNGEVRLVDLASAYAGLARGGLRPIPRTTLWTRTASGDTLGGPRVTVAPMALSPGAAFVVADILSDPEARAPGFGRGGPLELPFPVAVKTGTSKDYRDNWAVGASPRHTVAVWVGRFDGSPMHRVSGVSGAAPILRAIFEAMGSDGGFARPSGVVEGEVCPHAGHLAGRLCPSRRREWFLAGTLPRDTCRVHVAVALDRRSGLRADGTTPASERVVRAFTDYGPVFHGWMRARGLAVPPAVFASAARASGSAAASDRLVLDVPSDGTRLLLDPHLRRDYQRLAMRVRADAGLGALVWRVDGREVGRGPSHDWPLTPGRHTIDVTAVDESGRRLRSRPARVTVE